LPPKSVCPLIKILALVSVWSNRTQIAERRNFTEKFFVYFFLRAV
jgi:hypothetical protein